MSAASPKTQDKTQEPSMEEILASIRRIIADDQKPAEPPAPGSRPVAVPAPDEDDVLDLAMVAKPAPKPAPKPEPVVAKAPPKPEPSFDDALDPMSEIAFRDDEPMDFDAIEIEPEPAPPPPEPPKAVAPPPAPAPEPRPAMEDRLLSQATDATVGHAFDMLATTVLTRNARTIEDLVQDMLRPMLKAWLDDNLPVMVERLVRAEIERVARGR
ncbi:PopZ family protein [Methylobacterium sp. Gmos1]